jgi:hypothetical protein
MHMPNQRKKGLKLIGAYLPEREVNHLADEAKRRGLNSADLIREQLAEYLKRHPQEQPAKTKAPGKH